MTKNRDEQIAETERDDWNVEKISEEATNQMPDETMRQMLRGNKTGESADDRDVAGSANENETPQAREEAKRDSK